MVCLSKTLALSDIVTSAKGLGNGIPIEAVWVIKKYQSFLNLGSHGSTFGGNPFVSTISLEVLKNYKGKKFIRSCK